MSRSFLSGDNSLDHSLDPAHSASVSSNNRRHSLSKADRAELLVPPVSSTRALTPSSDAAGTRQSIAAATPLDSYHSTSSNSNNGELPKISTEDIVMKGVGSANSLSSSAPSSVFSHPQLDMSAATQYAPGASGPPALTPITNTESSPPTKMLSPRAAKRTYDQMQNGVSSPRAQDVSSQNASETITPIQTPPDPPNDARPGPKETKGIKCTYDPELDEKLSSSDRKRYKARYKAFGAENEPPAPPDPRLAIAGYSEGAYHRPGKASKTKLRFAPITPRPYPFDPRISIGRGPAVKVVVYGFDPLTPEVQIRTLLGSFGEIAEFDNKKDDAGSYVGVCSVLYKDSIAARKQTVKAAEAARRAEKEGTGQKIGVCTVTIERDPEATRARRQVTKIIKAQLMEQERLLQEELSRKRAAASSRQSAPRAPPVRPPPPIVIPKTPLPVKSETPVNLRAGTPPPNAPTGPAAKIAPFIPRTRHPEHSLVEQDPILPSLHRIPYIFISHESVPVLGTTIAHLKKRLRLYDWREVRCDPTGYYVVFEDSKRGEDETLRCYKECHMHPLFTYFMQMECHQYGNPNYVRSPSPERVAAEKRAAADRKRLREEDEADWQMERKERAQNLDLSIGVLDLLSPRLRDIILKDLKQKLATPALHDYLAPEKHTEKRRRYGIADPNAAHQQAPFQFTRDETPSVGTPNSRASFQAIFFKNKSLTFDKKGRPVPRKEDPSRLAPVNAFDDERRKKRPTKPRVVHALHRRMLEFEDSDSEDEKQTTFTRSDDQDSRAVSEVAPSPARLVDEDGSATPKKRRKLENGWAGAVESDDEIDVHSKSLLGHLLGKEPEDMAMRELHQVISTLPRHTKLRKRALAEVKLRKKAEEDDALFFGINKIKATEVAPMTDLVADDELSTATPEPETHIKAAKKKGTAKPVEAKPKKKTKKQILEEQEVAREEAKATENLLVEIEKEEAPTPEVLEPQEEEPRAEVEWSVSTERPRRTVEDDPELVLDIDGWQHLVKDDEDVRFLNAALHSHRMANLGDVKLWAWTQKEIKALNNGGVYGAVNKPITIEGYYVSNTTGCARTEGVKKILNSEKSKYLPHHIRVRKQREAREEQAKKDPAASAAELAKQVAAAKMASVQTSRSARANNRRLVNEIATQKQTLGLESDAMSFNQLKKRKKLVRFDRSAIHNWGLYADENIAAGDMIIEYVGELVRQRVADLREIKYQQQGIGSSYLFRIDEDLVVDATKKGGIARFINHSCAPSCTAKIIKVEGTKRIVIYALRDIAKNEELTYDYKFEREIGSKDRIPCLCGSVGCKGFLN